MITKTRSRRRHHRRQHHPGLRVDGADEPGKLLDSTAWNWSDLTAKKTDVGELRAVVRQPTRTLDELEMHITTLNPHTASHPPHTHPNEEMVIVKEGTLQAHVNGKEIVVGAGWRAVLRLDAAARRAEHRRHAGHLLRRSTGPAPAPRPRRSRRRRAPSTAQ